MVRYFFAGTNRRLPVEFVKGDERISVDANYFISVNDSNALLAAALAGMGVLQTLTFMAEPHFKSGALVHWCSCWRTGRWSRTRSISFIRPIGTSVHV
jgi:DNA-binding transcriptional LysR family regulator